MYTHAKKLKVYHHQYIFSVIGKIGSFELKFKWSIPLTSNNQFTQFLKLEKLYIGQIFKTEIGRQKILHCFSLQTSSIVQCNSHCVVNLYCAVCSVYANTMYWQVLQVLSWRKLAIYFNGISGIGILIAHLVIIRFIIVQQYPLKLSRTSVVLDSDADISHSNGAPD